ncbi:hypothetical protein JCM10450v2_008114 [Rhodotorula kratochvilovae]
MSGLEETYSKTDLEKNAQPTTVTFSGESEGNQNLHRGLKGRHVQMISIGGVIGTGLFLGTAGALRNGGPAGLLIGYSAIGAMCYAVMVSLGEMIAHLPIAGGHITLARRFASPALGFANAAKPLPLHLRPSPALPELPASSLATSLPPTYFCIPQPAASGPDAAPHAATIVLPADLNAAAIIIGYWNKTVNPGVWIAICRRLVVDCAINFGGSRAYGEAEFWFAIIKVLTIIGLIILGIIIDCGGGEFSNPSPFLCPSSPF